MALLVALLAATAQLTYAARPDNFLTHINSVHSDKLIASVNSKNPGWVAGKNKRFTYTTKDELKTMLGVRPGGPTLPVKDDYEEMVLPTAFDSRVNWPNCASIQDIRDQGHCGSCWAFGAVEAFSDRICITKGINVSISANDVLACCDSCGMGCDGGYPESAWQYFQSDGNVDDACDPYFDQKGCHHPGCTPELPTPPCVKQCTNGADWKSEKHFVSKVYSVASNEKAIMTEIFTNGPVEAAFSVYEDFATYTSGVYRHVSGGLLGGHAIKIIGWGVDPKAGKYWIVTNSWNRSWGENGFFRIRKGTNECGIESQAVAGIVKN